jgi:hypothetical protein
MGENSRARSGNSHRWRFLQLGGLDQVRIESRADLEHLGELDPKLWAALSCPTRGLEFDAKTLDFIDSDHDGRIRVPELLAAVKWACTVLRNPEELTYGRRSLALAAINDANEEGRQLLASARQILRNLGKPEATEIGPADTADTNQIFAHTRLNGDGVVTPDATDAADLQAAITDVAACAGSAPDRSGHAGITKALAAQFFADARAYAGWLDQAQANAGRVLPLGANTAAAVAAIDAVQAKVDDYFARCRLAAFDARAAAPLNRAEKEFEALAPRTFSATAVEVADFPLARVAPDQPLPLRAGVNPAWSDAVETLRTAVVLPLLGDRNALAQDEWKRVCAVFAPYRAWLETKAGVSVEKLGAARVRELLSGGIETRLMTLISEDEALAPEANAIIGVDRLVHFHRDLHTLLNNFVALRDFYEGGKKAIFQIGTLYLDGRSCELCIRVEDVAKHSAVATLSRTYIAYCDCVRRGGTERMTIAAAFTAGDSDQLLVGRNGVFFDRAGGDWDATIVRIVEHPISIRQAFWSPYKRIGRMIGEQIDKLASSRDKALQDKAAAGIADTGKVAEGARPAAAPAFDVGKFAGIFAAIGLAIGAIGTALASIVTGFLGLPWWQMPLALFGLLMVVSGPSMVIAALKLRQRNLGPLLDANGWAINARVNINLLFGRTLTGLAKLPPGAERTMKDPFAERHSPWGLYFVLLVVIAIVAYLWYHGDLATWFSAPGSTPPAP